MKKFVCIDIGGTAIKYGLLSKDGTILEKKQMNTQAITEGGKGILEKIKNITANYKNNNKIIGVCISTAGIVDAKNGIILYANANIIPEYTGMNIKKEIEKEFGIKCEVLNDVNCAGLAESWIGAGANSNVLVCLTIGTGIGGALIIDGKVLNGCSGSAGEIGYTKIMGKDFENIASTTALIQMVCSEKGIEMWALEGRDIVDLYENGDVVCMESIEIFSQNLAKGIANICYMANPDKVILGGGIMTRGDIFLPKIEKYLEMELMEIVRKNTKVQCANLGNDAGMIGALRNFLIINADII